MVVKANGGIWAIVLMGVSGCGKTTIGQKLSESLGWVFIEGDNFHPEENIKKMASGIPLTDEDRQPWLETLHNQLQAHQKDGLSAILACSALKECYRQTLRGELKGIGLVFLKGDFHLIQKRMQERAHFMKAKMLQSQFDVLEEPGNALIVDIRDSSDMIVQQIVKKYIGTTPPVFL